MCLERRSRVHLALPIVFAALAWWILACCFDVINQVACRESVGHYLVYSKLWTVASSAFRFNLWEKSGSLKLLSTQALCLKIQTEHSNWDFWVHSFLRYSTNRVTGDTSFYHVLKPRACQHRIFLSIFLSVHCSLYFKIYINKVWWHSHTGNTKCSQGTPQHSTWNWQGKVGLGTAKNWRGGIGETDLIKHHIHVWNSYKNRCKLKQATDNKDTNCSKWTRLTRQTRGPSSQQDWVRVFSRLW